MPIINFSFTKINAYKNQFSNTEKINVDESIGIDDIKELDMNISGSQKTAVFMMGFKANYKQGSELKAAIDISSSILYMDEKKVIEDLVNDWKNKKPMPEKILEAIHNLALTKSLVHALNLADTLGLVAPISLPKVKVTMIDTKAEDKKETKKAKN